MRDYELLYNPGNAAQIEWRPWKGPWPWESANFPLGVFKLDEECGLMVGRYNDGDETAMIDRDGYVFYQQGLGSAWYWDDNEYDLLVERAATGIEILELSYGEELYDVTKRLENSANQKGKAILDNCKNNETTELERTFEKKVIEGKSWSHAVQFGISRGGNIGIELNPLKGIIGSISAKLGFEASFSYEHGWGSSKSMEKMSSTTIRARVQPGMRTVVDMFMSQREITVPYTAKYKVTFSDHEHKIVRDHGKMTNLIYTESKAEPCSCNCTVTKCEC